jgi:segregation and condensation protein B
MEHTENETTKENQNETVLENTVSSEEENAALECDAEGVALERDSHNDEENSQETPPQQQDYEAEGEELEEWDLHPTFPAEEDLLYPGQEMLELEQEYLDDEKQEESLWQARTGLDNETLCGAIETVIFMSDKPVPINKIKSLIDEDMPLRVIHQSITRLQEEYETRHHGLRLVEVAEGYQFRTKATYSKYVQDLFKVNSLVLSPTALEVLAIVAYKQPVAKTEVDKIRGVDSGHIVRGLIDKRLVKVVGRSDEMGRPVLYGTTPEFLEVFNLANIDQLPPEHELEETLENSVGKISDIKNIVHDGDKERFVFDDIDELDELASSIKQIAADTEFTSALKTEEKNKLKSTQTEESTEKKEVRTAFDILEDYVSRQVIINANSEAGESEMMTDSADPRIIHDLTAGPFNTPEEEEDEEDFQMIDLDTGLPIEEEEFEVEADFDLEAAPSDESEEAEESGEEVKGIDLLQENEDEAAELAKALDDAFERLTGEKLEEDELGLRDKNLDEKEDELIQMAERISNEAKDLDLDLDFLKDNQDVTGPEDENSTDV